MEEQLKRIVDGRHVCAIMVWPDGDGFLGCLLDNRVQQITGSTTWNDLATVDAVLDSLERAAIQHRKNQER